MSTIRLSFFISVLFLLLGCSSTSTNPSGTPPTPPPPAAVSTTTTLSAASSTLVVGSPDVLTVQVLPATATGAVTFFDGTTNLGNATLVSGKASLTATSLTAGSNSLSAVYAGDASDASSTSATILVLVTTPVTPPPLPPAPVATTTTLSAALSSVVVGSSDVLTAQVTPPTATGAITFLDGTTALGNSTLASGKASFTATSLTTGTNVLSAVYSGDSADTTSTSAAVDVQVTAATVPPAAVTIDPSNPAILYSPYNWSVTQGYARTINSGAYFRTVFSGTSATLLTDTTPNQSAFSEFWARIDNQGWSQYSLSAGNPQISVATNLANRKHVLEVVIKSTSQYLPRWTNSQTVVQFTGILLDAGAQVYAPLRRSKNVLILGDSITEGVHALGTTATLDTDQNDILGDYSYVTATALDAEVGIVAFGAQGITEGGSGSVPPLTSTYNQIFDGVARDFKTYPPDLVIYNEGTNDFLYNVTPANFVSAYTSVIQGILTAAPSSKHLVLIPFDQAYAANIPTMTQAFGSSQVTYGATSGWFDPAESSDGLHPYNYEHIAYIAPKLIPLAVQALR